MECGILDIEYRRGLEFKICLWKAHTNNIRLLFSVFRPDCDYLECAADFPDCVARGAGPAVLLAVQARHLQPRAVQGARRRGGGRQPRDPRLERGDGAPRVLRRQQLPRLSAEPAVERSQAQVAGDN